MSRPPLYLVPFCLLLVSVVQSVAAAEPYVMLVRNITEGVTDDLAGAAGVERGRWKRAPQSAVWPP